MTTLRRAAALGVLVSAVALLAACGGSEDGSGQGGGDTGEASAPSGEPLRLGVLAGLTGGSNTIGVPYVNGAKLAASEINAEGGIDGRPVELVVADNETQPVAGVQAALKLVNSDNVKALLCSCFSTIFFPIMEAVGNRDVVLTNNGASTPQIRDLPADNFVTTMPTDDVLGAELARWAYGLGYERAALLTVNDPYGTAFRDVVGEAYREAGGEIVADVVVDGGLPDYRPELRRIANAGEDLLVLMGTYTADARLQFRQLTQLGWSGPAFKLYPSATELNKDPEANGRFYGLESTWVDDEAGREWQQRYRDEYGEDPNVWAALGYDAAQLNARVLADAGDAPADERRDAIREAAEDYEGPTGSLEFDDDFIRVNPSLAFYKLVDGEYVRVDESGEPVE